MGNLLPGGKGIGKFNIYLSKYNKRAVLMSKEILKEAALLFHPVRYKIVETLRREKTPMYIDEIAGKINEDRRLVSFHLSTLEDKGLAKSEFKVIKKAQSKGKAGRFYTLTPRVDVVLTELAKMIKV